MSDYERQVKGVIEALTIHSMTSFSWLGRTSPPIPTRLRRALTAQTARSYLLYLLQLRLYHDFYQTGAVVAGPGHADEPVIVGATPFVEALSAAHVGDGCYEPGWTVVEAAESGVHVRRGGLTVRVPPTELVVAERGAITAGQIVTVRLPKERLADPPGFYSALGRAPLDVAANPAVRVYWNLTAAGAVPFVAGATRALGETALRFRLKTLNDPHVFTRCDAGVIYLYRTDFAAAGPLLEWLYDELRPFMRAGVPAFTKSLAPGLAIAEHPGPGASFGLHRCQLLADGLIRAYETGRSSPGAQLDAVRARFAEEGLRLDAPYLSPGSPDQYHLRRPHSPGSLMAARSAVGESPDERERRCAGHLQVAAEIGDRLVHDAIWFEDRCTWMGTPAAQERKEWTGTGGGSRGVLATVGADLYGGAAGISLFLAQLCSATGDAAHRRAALGAARHALAGSGAVGRSSRLGLYIGQAGLALAVARIGALLSEDDLLRRAAALVRDLLASLDSRSVEPGRYDLVWGRAGAALALLALRGILRDDGLLDAAVALADQVIDNAERAPVGVSWPTAGGSSIHNLTGLSHGAAGIGYALLQLEKVTGARRYREAAESAFEYERHWFDANAGNWPDFRTSRCQGLKEGAAWPNATNWCHGAPGIALARAAAYATLGEERYRAEAVVALDTTRRALAARLAEGTGNFSLCHGLAGNADILAHAARELSAGGEPAEADVELVHAVAEAGVQTRDREGGAWRCGVPGGETPSLMLGLAGIGWFYLRLADPAIPSVLLIDPEEFSRR